MLTLLANTENLSYIRIKLLLIPLVTFLFMNAMPCSRVIAASISGGYTYTHFDVDSNENPNATWQEAPHTGVGEIIYNGKPSHYYDPPTVARVNGLYIRSNTDVTEAFKGAEFYFYAGDVDPDTMVDSFDMTINIPGIAEEFVFELEFEMNNDGTQSVIITDDTADAIVTIDGVEYQLQLLGFGDDSNDLSKELIAEFDSVSEADLYFQFIPTVVPLPSTGMMTAASLCALLLVQKRKRRNA
ncbi:hypothetical protein JD969_08850 [Planctomycetota bacterium]|nr:hypothetical protein JD969_08850 [Planctomycetota bacterium]